MRIGRACHASRRSARVVRGSVAALADERAVAAPVRPRPAPLLQRARARALAQLLDGEERPVAPRHGRHARRARASRLAAAAVDRGRSGSGAIGSAVIVGMVLLVHALVRVPAVRFRRPVVAAPLGPRAFRRRRVARRAVVDARRRKRSPPWRRSCCWSASPARFRRWWLIAAPVFVVIARCSSRSCRAGSARPARIRSTTRARAPTSRGSSGSST